MISFGMQKYWISDFTFLFPLSILLVNLFLGIWILKIKGISLELKNFMEISTKLMCIHMYIYLRKFVLIVIYWTRCPALTWSFMHFSHIHFHKCIHTHTQIYTHNTLNLRHGSAVIFQNSATSLFFIAINYRLVMLAWGVFLNVCYAHIYVCI